MNAEEIKAIQRVSRLYTKERMFQMLAEREPMIKAEMDKIANREFESEDVEMVAINY